MCVKLADTVAISLGPSSARGGTVSPTCYGRRGGGQSLQGAAGGAMKAAPISESRTVSKDPASRIDPLSGSRPAVENPIQ